MGYYNTNGEVGKVLAESNKKAYAQEEKIKSYFEVFNVELTCENLYFNIFKNDNVPLTSVRRAVHNLVKKGVLIATGNKRLGMYGKYVMIYKLNLHNPK